MREWSSAVGFALPPRRIVTVLGVLALSFGAAGALPGTAAEPPRDLSAAEAPQPDDAPRLDAAVPGGEALSSELSEGLARQASLDEPAGFDEQETGSPRPRSRYPGRGFRERTLVSRDIVPAGRPFADFGRGPWGRNGDDDDLDIAHDDFPEPEEDPRALQMLSHEGFVFVKGEYVAPPYHVDFRDDKVFINDLQVDYPVPDYHPEYGRRWRMQREGMPPRFNPVFMVVRELREGGAIVEVPGQMSVSLNQPLVLREFLKYVADTERPAKAPDVLLDYLPPHQRGPWSEWMRTFVPTTELQEHVEFYLTGMDSVETANIGAIAAVRRLDRFAYPLTVFGMVCVVLAVGHLLQNRPAEGAANEPSQITPQALRIVTRSMLLVLVLSGLDLAWTILASQAGQMKELNPLGSHLIQDPLALVLFKTSLTCMSVGLIFGLRKHRPAQVASWWACLICTLLTVRWLVFNSMFIA